MADEKLTEKKKNIKVREERDKKSSRSHYKYSSAGSTPYPSTSREFNMVGRHSGSTVGLILFNLVIFGGTVALLHLSVFPQFTAGIFQDDIRNVTAKYELTVTPADWVHFIWSVIFAWLLLGKFYALILLCRRNAVGPLYTSPRIVSRAFMLLYIVGLLCLAAWVILWDRMYLIATCAVMGSAALIFWIASGILHYRLYRHGPWMSRHLQVDIWFYRVLWHNGMAALTTAVTMAFIYNLGVVLRYVVELPNQPDQIVAYSVLGGISGVMLLWFVLENTALDRFMRYTISIYPVIITFLVGVYYRQYNDSSEETGYFLVALLGVAVFCFVARIGLLILRTAKSPLYINNKVNDDPVLAFSQ